MTVVSLVAPEQDALLSAEDQQVLLAELLSEWSALRPGFEELDDYYRGQHSVIIEPVRQASEHVALVGMAVSNWTKLVVDVVAERLVVGSISTLSDEAAQRAWTWWTCNYCGSRSSQLMTEALKFGVAYSSVWPGELHPRITGESPLQLHVRFPDDNSPQAIDAVKVWEARDAKTLYATVYTNAYMYRFTAEVSAGSGTGESPLQLHVRFPDDNSPQAIDAVKVWEARDAKTLYATVYTNAYMYRFTAEVSAGSGTGYTASTGVRVEDLTRITWIPRVDDELGPIIPNPVHAVPFNAFYCQPDLLGGYASEIAGVIPIQDRINKTTFDRMVSQEFTAFPQRWVTGIDIPRDPDTGQPIEPFNAAVDRVWAATSADTAFGQFPAADPAPYLKAIEADIQALATQSRTPPHYLVSGMGQFPSGESVRATEYGLMQKVRNRQESFGDGWARTIRMAGLVANDTEIGEDENLRVTWADVEARSEGELVDSLLKMATLNVPETVLWEKWGASPEEVRQWIEMNREMLVATAGLISTAQDGSLKVDVPRTPDQQAAQDANAPAPVLPPTSHFPGQNKSGGGTA